MKNRVVIFLIFSIALFIMLGCSNADNPISSSAYDEKIPSVGDSFSTDIALWGGYNLYISDDLSSVELTPLRNMTIGESYIVNGILYFTATPCSTCLKLRGIGTDGINVKVTFSITHPFEPGITTEPPSATNRLDLNVFDVAMIVVPTDKTPQQYSSVDIYANSCVKMHGFTRELSNITGENAACPYFLVVDDSTSGVSTYNKFAMGTKDKLFDIWLKNTGTYQVYLTMAYGASAKKAQRLTPTYYNPEFNRKAAWKVDVIPPEGSDPPAVGNTWNDVDLITKYPVTVRVCDWQIGATVNPSLTLTTDIFASSNVGSVSVEIPGMTILPETSLTPLSGTGKPNDPLIYRVNIANELGLPPGEYIGLVQVLDQRSPQDPIIDRDYLIDFILPEPMTNVTPAGLNFPAEDVSVSGNFAYVASTPATFRVVDVSNPSAAYELGSLPVTSIALVYAANGYAYVCDADSMMIMDVSSPDSPSIIKDVGPLNFPRDMSVRGEYAYVATDGGLVMIDVIPPASAIIKKGVSTGGQPKRLAVDTDYAYITTTSGSSSFLEIIEIINPTEAFIVSQTSLILPAGALFAICVVDDMAYITGQRTLVSTQNQFLIVDVDPAETPLVNKVVNLSELALCVDVKNDYAYVGCLTKLEVIDVKPASTAFIITSVSIPHISANIDVENGYIFLADTAAGLEIISSYIPAGGGLANFTMPEYATYQVFPATVVDL